MEWIENKSFPFTTQNFTVPHYDKIAINMFANIGLIECNEIGVAFNNLLLNCKEKASKQ